MKPLNLFYGEPDPDRWFKFDRYPRKLIRRIIRGKHRPGGVMQASLNLIKGFDKLGVSYRLNDYRYVKKHRNEIACILGKPEIIYDHKWNNPIIFGTGTFNHPVDNPSLLNDYQNIKHIVVFGEWMRQMFIGGYGERVSACPAGIDTDQWKPVEKKVKYDFLIYDKIRWNYEIEKKQLVDPITQCLEENELTYQFIKYGSYDHQELMQKLSNSRSVIFLCEHETQGLAYQQILATDTPILAWDRGGFWRDPAYYPNKVQFEPVSSVPYWDERCGKKFVGAADFEQALNNFLEGSAGYNPRQFILDNFTLEKCSQRYLDIYNKIQAELM